MRIFLVVFFLIYGSMHVYALLKAKAALSLRAQVLIPLALLMAAMTAAPVIIRYLERLHFEVVARIISYIGYVWMGVLVMFFLMAICIDVYRLLVYIAGMLVKTDLSAVSMSAKTSFFIPLIFALAGSAYGYFEAKDIRVEHVTIKSAKIPEQVNPLRVVQISDVHVGLIVREDRLRRIIEKVKSESPDILVCTGDFVDGQINRLEGLAEILQEVKPRYGKFAITGNHEYYAGLDQALDFTRKAGFTILRGEAVETAGINIAGVDDGTGRQFGRFNGTPEKKLLSGLDRSKFTVLLKHRPLVLNDTTALFDLQLSGHTHKGQLFPFSLITKLYYPKHAGLLKLANNALLYTSRGSGTWGPPVRFLSPPEVTVIELLYHE